jgi:BirA family biotin operon repressor/biotin-[acetyl-CoA-carboxylase] ligase
LTELLSARRFGRRVYYYPETDSTNRVAVELIRRGEAEGCLVVADYQTAGRGRLDRVWTSPPGRDLLFTLILRPDTGPVGALPLTLVIALAAAGHLSEVTGSDIGVKWPNDIVIGGAKLGGILAEKPSLPDGATALAVGIGINVNSRPDDFPPAYRDRAVSCSSLSGAAHDRADVLAGLLGAMENLYDRFCAEGFSGIRPQYENRLLMRGERVTFERGHTRYEGLVEGVENDGALRVRPEGKNTTPLLLYGEEVISQT